MSKINLLDVTLKNFGSFGNDETHFEYQSGINVVTGHVANSTRRNGIGKSTLLVDAASFAIYGKPLRGGKVKKDELVNNINKKNCEVTLRIKINDEVLKIVRKIKPSSLEVFVNDCEEPKKFDSMSHTQEWIENKIGVNHTCFSNIMVLNVNTSIPFLAMDASKKREVIEDVLSLGVYGKMSDVARGRHLDAQKAMKEFEIEFSSALSSYTMAKENRESIDKEKQAFEERKQKQIDNLNKELKKLTETKNELELKVSNNDIESKKDKIENSLNNLLKKKITIESEITSSKKSIQNFNSVIEKLSDQSHCPLCKSNLDSTNEIALQYINECKENLDKSKVDLTKFENELKDLIEKETSLKDKLRKAKTLIQQYNEDKIELSDLTNSIKNTQEDLDEVNNSKFEMDDIIPESKLNDLLNDLNEKEKLFNESEEEMNHFRVIRKLLGEDGMRKFVVSKILPFFNSKINETLKKMGSEYTVTFDVNLDEKILTKTRDDRAYTSLSSGEKKRVDISIILALMDLAKLQNSVDTNILILDEVLDTSMDTEGVEAFLNYLQNNFMKLYPDKCVYIITHRKEIADDVFDRLINLINKNGFTTIESIINF